jgi:CHAD domain-containing protein
VNKCPLLGALMQSRFVAPECQFVGGLCFSMQTGLQVNSETALGFNVAEGRVPLTLPLPGPTEYSTAPKAVVRGECVSKPRVCKSEQAPVSGVLDWRPGGERRLALAAGVFLADTLGRRWETYRKELRVCKHRFSARTVHELRVASRRLIAQLVMLGCVGVGTREEEARRVLKRRLKALSELRDVHVQRLFIEQQMTRFPDLSMVCDDLRRRERKLERVAAGKVKRFKTRKLRKSLEALAVRLTRRSGQADYLAAKVTQATARAFADVARRRQAIDPAKPSTIHRTRIAFKKFRYMVESLSPEFTGLSKRDLRVLAVYQRKMGILQDLEVLQQLLSDFVRRHRHAAELLDPFARYLRARRARALRSFMKTADALFGFWPLARAHREAA